MTERGRHIVAMGGGGFLEEKMRRREFIKTGMLGLGALAFARGELFAAAAK
jgi:hypothetical protein